MESDVARRQSQVPEAEQAVLAYHAQAYGGGSYSAVGRVKRGC